MEAAHRPACALHPCLTSLSSSGSLLLSAHLPDPRHQLASSTVLLPLHRLGLHKVSGLLTASHHSSSAHPLAACSEGMPEGPHPLGSLWPGFPELKCPSLLHSSSGLEDPGVKHPCPDGSRTKNGQFPIGTLECGQPTTFHNSH